MRNNVNSNGMINGGYSATNPNVIPIPYFNQEISSVPLSASPFLSPQPFMGSPQPMSYQTMYNQIPNYYPMGVINYPPAPQTIPYGSILIKPTGLIPPSTPSRLDIVDPNTGSNINLSCPTPPAQVKRRSTLQIIDPVSKSEIDVTKILLEKQKPPTIVETSEENDKKDFKFNFPIDNQPTESIVIKEEKPKLEIKPCDSPLIVKQFKENKEKIKFIQDSLINEKIDEVKPIPVEEIPIKPEEKPIVPVNIEKEKEKISDYFCSENVVIDNDEDENDFTEVVNKKKKKQQSKVLVQEQKMREKQQMANNNKKDPKRDNHNNNNGNNNKNKRSNNDSGNNKNNRKFTNNREEIVPEKNEKEKIVEINAKEIEKNLPEVNINIEKDQNNNNNNSWKTNSRSTQRSGHRNEHHNSNGAHHKDYYNQNLIRNESVYNNSNNQRSENFNQRSESRNSSISRNESRNPSLSRNVSRDVSYQRNDNRTHNNRNHNIHGNDNRNIPRNDTRFQGNQRTENNFDRNEKRFENRNRNWSNNHSNEYQHKSIENNESNNMNNNGNQKIDNNHRQHQRSDSKRNGDWKRNRNFSGNNYHRNNRPEEQTVIEHDTKPVTDSQEFKVPIKQPLSYARAFRKSSSPLYSDQSKEIDKAKEIEAEKIEMSLEINLDQEKPIEKEQFEEEQVKDEQVEEQVTEEKIEEEIIENNIEEEEVVKCEEEIIPEIPADPIIEENKPELIEESKPELIEETQVLEPELKVDEPELEKSEEVLGRLVYYRDNLLALRGSQSIPEELFMDPALMDVISSKMQIINFLKKKEIYVKSNIARTDYLDFTRRNHHIRPKRLVRGENGYLPPQMRQKQSDDKSILQRNIKSILNKMTPENFEICYKDIQDLNIGKENMRCLVEEVFSKAIQEESYCSTYAKFCCRMSDAPVEAKQTDRLEPKTFKGVLLKDFCQQMFEKSLHLQLEEVKTFWEQKSANETDERMKKLYESDIEEQVKKAKDKYFGNIRFFSELFLVDQMSWKIIISCAEKLLRYEKDVNSLEAACKLIQICGKKLDQIEIGKPNDKKFSTIMSQFTSLSNRMDIEPRIRFKLKDIVDMRARDWELRVIQKAIISVPKTLDEIKEERIKEDNEKIKTNYNQQPVQNPQRFRSTLSRQAMDTKRLQLNSQHITKETVLGPQIRTQWGSGCKSNNNGWNSVSSNRKASVINETPAAKPEQQVKVQNKYAQLYEEEIEVEQSVPIPIVIETNDEDVSKELFDLMMKNTPAVDRWNELVNPVSIIEKWFDVMFERKIECRQRLGDYFHDLIANNCLTFENLIKGSSVTMSAVDDIIDDVPNFWEYLAQFLERFIKNENSQISFFNNLFDNVEGYEPNIKKCLSSVKKYSSDRIGGDIVEDLFRRYQQ